MAEKNEPSPERVFLAEDILPDASSYFEDEPQRLEEAIEDADIVLDTNVLLIPFGAGASSLEQITKVYEEIKERHRLFIPAQVSREFVKNRPNKLAQLYQGISDKISQLTVPDGLSYPVLGSVVDFLELNEQIGRLNELKVEIKASAKKVRSTIKAWGWNDPVSQAYRPIFTKDIVISPSFDRDKVLSEMLSRYQHSIPPGYKDASKPDAGIGDFLIWKTILHLGETNHRNVVFVSGDEKADWFHGAEGSGFLPRYELQAEFRRVSEGRDLYIIPLSHLLELQKAEESSVDEVRTEERRAREATSVEAECPECESVGEYELAEDIGASALPACIKCGSKFHLHRVREGISSHRYKGPGPSSTNLFEVVECPYCEDENLRELGDRPFSTAWCYCDGCGERFPIHRRADGSVFAKKTKKG